MIAYKLVREMKDGTIAPLFINKKSRIPMGEWLESENHPTKGFAERQGWHCTLYPYAPHLTEKGRVWVQVMVEDYKLYDRPESQGGTWVLANRMIVLQKLSTDHLARAKRVLLDKLLERPFFSGGTDLT